MRVRSVDEQWIVDWLGRQPTHTVIRIANELERTIKAYESTDRDSAYGFLLTWLQRVSVHHHACVRMLCAEYGETVIWARPRANLGPPPEEEEDLWS